MENLHLKNLKLPNKTKKKTYFINENFRNIESPKIGFHKPLDLIDYVYMETTKIKQSNRKETIIEYYHKYKTMRY